MVNSTGKSRTVFILTLDADTQLPHTAARKLIGTLGHPLNRPDCENTQHRLGCGYVVLQPRVSVHLESANRTRFALLFANNPGVDPYATCASDVYQDLFGEGSFTGKGIYDLAAFSQAVDGSFPENQILSHDLIEGCHARVALVSDIELFDNYPPRYEADARRQHRWTRGDWQILAWLLPRVPGPRGWHSNPLSALSRWKIFDNLRRSIVPSGLLGVLLLGWLVASPVAMWFTVVTLLVLAFPLLAQLAMSLISLPPRNVTPADEARLLWRDLRHSLFQWLFGIAVLPQRAWSTVDAVTRTMWRTVISRRKLLEWETASEVEQRLGKSRWGPLFQMWYSLVLALSLPLILPFAATLAAIPFLPLWLCAPAISYWTALPLSSRPSEELSPRQRDRLRLEARRIWSFFETYVNEQGNWLPPDNVQEYPFEKIAYRTSPTNEGLYLVSAMVARELGYLSLHELADRWEKNLHSWEGLDRLHGHFYNWYETAELRNLRPRYISTVDSGNLAACFLTAQQGVAELIVSPWSTTVLQQGLEDAIAMIFLDAQRAKIEQDPKLAKRWGEVTEVLDEVRLSRTESSASRRDGFCPSQPWKQWSECELKLEQLLQSTSFHVNPDQDRLAIKLRQLLAWFVNVRQEWSTLFAWRTVMQSGLLAAESVAETDVLPIIPRLVWMPQANSTAWQDLWGVMQGADSLRQVAELRNACDGPLAMLRKEFAAMPPVHLDQALAWHASLSDCLQNCSANAHALELRLQALARRFERLALEMDFSVLFDRQRRLFSIGFNLEEGKLDSSHYDMLCSEARIASYVAIAKGDVEAQHWFRLGRRMTQAASKVTLLSWGGTMFEYLMPCLFQKQYENSLLTQSCRTAIARQQEYGRQRNVPWGMSECAFGALAANSDYHYRSFGTPGLGLKRGLAKDLVIAPYATFLTVEFDPHDALQNLDHLQLAGGLGEFGFYDAIDYTPERVPIGREAILVRCYMAHHQGMSLLAIGNTLLDECVRRRFHTHSMIRSSELLLQEKTPSVVAPFHPRQEEQAVPSPQPLDQLISRRILGVEADAPRTHLLSNGNYSVALAHTGIGFSQCGDFAISRWRADQAREPWGQFLYLRNTKTGRVWSPTFQPTCVLPDSYEVIYSIDKADFHRIDGELETLLEVVVSPENQAESRQLKLTNHSDETIEIEVTSYLEIALVSQAADVAHPAFQKLFIETEYIAEEAALLAKRRPREAKQDPQWAVHVLSTTGEYSTVEYETDRAAFIGRNRSLKSPAAFDGDSAFQGTLGAVLDPILALRTRIAIPAAQSAMIAFSTAFAKTREEALALADQYHDPRGVQRAFELAWAYAQVELRHLHISPTKMHLFQKLGGKLLFPEPGLRANAQTHTANTHGQRGLWRYGISGDLPLLVVHVTAPDQIGLVRELMQAIGYLHGRGLKADLVILNDYPGSYFDALQDQLVALLNERQATTVDNAAGVFILRGAQLPAEDHILLDSAASVVLSGERGSLEEQLEVAERLLATAPVVTSLAESKQRESHSLPITTKVTKHAVNSSLDSGARGLNSRIVNPADLEFWNGTGGFAHDGREYHIQLRPGNSTPMPWSNVIANERFGCLLTESGGGYSWFENSRENKLTSWSNDPILDLPSELLLLKDRRSGETFSPFASCRRDQSDYWIQHGQGYSRYLHESHGITQEVLISIAPQAPVKFVTLKLGNLRDHPRSIDITYVAQWVLGVDRESTQLHLVTSIDEVTRALLVRNPYHPELSQSVAFLQTLSKSRTWTCDRQEIFGKGDRSEFPLGNAESLSQRVGAGFDTCGALQTTLELPACAELEIVFILGAGRDLAEVQQLLATYSTPADVEQACHATRIQWDEILSTIQVKTPNRALDLMVNRWLLYQTLSCRVFGRSAYYQAGGAYGFRDQLQDVMALLYSQPRLARDHLLRAAARQYEEGDVQHWWHPPAGRGTRTRFADDLLWLPLVACRYVTVTGDQSIWAEMIQYLHSPLLDEREQERYELPGVSAKAGTFYEHCLRTIQHGFRVGPHGLPRMGCGDWNDGMSNVGPAGKGESVWMGWFLLVILERFLPVMRQHSDNDAADQIDLDAQQLRDAMETKGWDGDWYRRAFFDDGTPLGSAENVECQIDSIAQTWAVFANAPEAHSRPALEAVMQKLVRWEDQLVLLFSPPFDQSNVEPGYIKGYLPGIRENGGQYTHPAVWLIEALTKLGDGDRAIKVFDLINPIHHSQTADQVARYQVEPYVVAADVYGVSPNVGRGGWTWYTGSAAWMYRTALESILGLTWDQGRISFQPTIPTDWTEFEVTIRKNGESQTFRYHQGKLAVIPTIAACPELTPTSSH